MNVKQYEQAVIELFKSGKASEECWAEMAAAVLHISETSGTDFIDAMIFNDPQEPTA